MKRVMLLLASVFVAALVAGGTAHAASPPAELTVSKATPSANVSVGQDFVWTVRVVNRGRAQANDVRVVDTLPYSSVRLLNIRPSQGGPCAVRFPKVVCTLGTIPAGERAVIKFYVRTTQAGPLRNTVRVSTATPEINLTNNRAVSVVRAS